MNNRLLLAVVLGVVLAPGCGAASDESSGILLTRATTGADSEMDALPSGTLEIDLERGCVLLSGRPVVWPAETALALEPPELELPGGLTARSGDTIRGGGGALPAAHVRETAIEIEGDVDKALECAPSAESIVVFTARGEAMTVSPG